jgi:hypothetical protein
MKPRSAAFDKLTNVWFLTLEQMHQGNLTPAVMRETIYDVTSVQFWERPLP